MFVYFVFSLKKKSCKDEKANLSFHFDRRHLSSARLARQSPSPAAGKKKKENV
jgi:hypothetical protein